jgi:hypothetical protein
MLTSYRRKHILLVMDAVTAGLRYMESKHGRMSVYQRHAEEIVAPRSEIQKSFILSLSKKNAEVYTKA